MKIENWHSAKTLPPQSGQPGGAAASRFEDLFSQKISEMDPARNRVATNPVAQIVQQGDKLINLLDHYAQDLKNPAKSLKEIAPLAAEIAREVDVFEDTAAKNPLEDRKLNAIVNELRLTANVALFKFERGDYL